ncbi:MAG: hypothetical protein LBT38_10690, partial [Deltaproteobacteria bacterium]|nr:hypothetical protein [Deltaproteobacteria bacterium]
MSLLRSTKKNIDKNSPKPSKRPEPAPKLPGPNRQTKAKNQLAPKPLIGLPVGEFMAQPRP